MRHEQLGESDATYEHHGGYDCAIGLTLEHLAALKLVTSSFLPASLDQTHVLEGTEVLQM
jgi:hypothetical protein